MRKQNKREKFDKIALYLDQWKNKRKQVLFIFLKMTDYLDLSKYIDEIKWRWGKRKIERKKIFFGRTKLFGTNWSTAIAFIVYGSIKL